MKWYKSIPFTAPVREVRLAPGASTAPRAQPDPGAEQAAYERGRRDGESALNEQLIRQRTELLAVHQGVVESLRNAIPALVRETETALIDLAMETAKRVVAQTPVSRETVEAIVREALRQVEDTTDITVHLHPDDLALLRRHESPILQGLPETGPLRFIGSAEVTSGGCMIHTRFGLLDARRETKLEQLRQSLSA